jgi:hypothetical protein
MMNTRVLLMTLSKRTSAKGVAYLSGWLGKAKLVAFKSDEPDKYGNPVWNIYASEPEPKADTPGDRDGQRAWGGPRDVQAIHRERHTQRSRAQAAGEAMLEHAPRRHAIGTSTPAPLRSSVEPG